MRLLRLHILGFGCLRERVLEFGPRLTLLVGPNEVGKSTVLHCLAQTLLGKPTQRSNFPDFTPWDAGPFAAEVDFEESGMTYRLSRRFDESGSRAQLLHRLCADGSQQLITQENSEVRKWIAGAFGTADDRIFYRVFCLARHELTPLDNYTGLREHLERAVSGADMAVAAAAQRLDERLAVLRRGISQPALPHNWGALKRAEEARREWEERCRQGRSQHDRLREVRGSAEALQQQLAAGIARIDVIAGVLEQDRRRRDLVNRLSELRASWTAVESDLEQVARLATERDRLRAELDPLPPSFADPGLLRARLQDAGQDIAPWRRAGWSMLLGGGACSVLLSLVLHHALWLLLAPVAIAVGIQRLLRAAQLSQRVTACCSELEVATLAEANRRLEEIERSRRALEGTEMALRALAKDESLTERRRGLALEIATTEALLAEIPGAVLQAEEAHRLSAESQALRTSLPALREQERNLTRELAVLEETERDLLDLEDGAEYWRREEAQAREEEQTLLLARELLLDAGRQAHHAFAEPLATRISPLFAAITRGRYPRVRVENDARGFQVQPMTVAGVPVAPEQLSHGAGEQFLLAVRLALGLVVAGPEGTPIFLLDDPLQHFDEERRRHALTVLTEFSAATQMLLATHDPRAIAEFPGATVVKMAG